MHGAVTAVNVINDKAPASRAVVVLPESRCKLVQAVQTGGIGVQGAVEIFFLRRRTREGRNE